MRKTSANMVAGRRPPRESKHIHHLCAVIRPGFNKVSFKLRGPSTCCMLPSGTIRPGALRAPMRCRKPTILPPTAAYSMGGWVTGTRQLSLLLSPLRPLSSHWVCERSRPAAFSAGVAAMWRWTMALGCHILCLCIIPVFFQPFLLKMRYSSQTPPDVYTPL